MYLLLCYSRRTAGVVGSVITRLPSSGCYANYARLNGRSLVPSVCVNSAEVCLCFCGGKTVRRVWRVLMPRR